MGTYSNWLTHNIPDPTSIDAELYLALSALDAVIDELSSAEYISFTDDSFFSTLVTTVGDALREIGDYLAADQLGRRLVAVPSYGAALVNDTNVFSILAHRDGVLGIAYIYLDTAPAGTACELQILKNGATMYSFSFAVADHGPLTFDMSFISVNAGDLITLRCIVASGAAGLSCSVEL